ncbi:hypothetical protein KP509_14G001600 [Ceratopteris richardii]|nr:hypothetical protein KP509_14G001600 [Ceratopteris richardii]
MNRDINTDTLRKQQQSPSPNYLLYLLVLSFGLVVVFPFIFPSRSLLSWSGSEDDGDASGRNSLVDNNRRSSGKKSTSASMTLYDRSLSYDNFDRRCASLEALVMDLQGVVQVERERTTYLESEIRTMQMSENFLKNRVHYLEERNLALTRDVSPSSSFSSPSIDPLLRNAQSFTSDGRPAGDVPETIFHDLLKIVQVERERTLALESEIRHLQKSEASLQTRVQVLEEKFASSCKDSFTKEDSSKGKW